MTAPARESVFDLIVHDHHAEEAARFLCGEPDDADKKRLLYRCPRHGQGDGIDENPSLYVFRDSGTWGCVCNAQSAYGGGTLANLGIHFGRGVTQADVAKLLDDHFRPHTNGGPAPAAAPPPAFPFFPKTAEALGWEIVPNPAVNCSKCHVSAGETPLLRIPTSFPGQGPGPDRWRGPRHDCKPKAMFVAGSPNGGSKGLVNWKSLDDPDQGEGKRTIWMTAGETDLLAFAYYAVREGIYASHAQVPVFTQSAGEKPDLSLPPEAVASAVARLKEDRLVVLGDADDTGKKVAGEFVAWARAQGIDATAVFPPTGKDVREYLAGGGTVRELLRIAEAPPEKTFTAKDVALLLAGPEPPAPDEFIEHLIVRPSVNIVFGQPGSGKSYALLHGLHDAIHGGGTFCGVEGFQIRPDDGRFGGEPDRVLWVYGSEDNERRMHVRMQLSRQYGPHAGKALPETRFFINTPPGGIDLGNAEGLRWLEAEIVGTKATIVVLDTVASLTSATLDPNKAEAVAPFLRTMHILREKHRLILILVHHTRKGGNDPKQATAAKADSMIGSQAWRALTDSVIMLDAPDGDASCATLRLIKGKDIDRPPAAVKVTMEPDSKRFRPLDDEEAVPEREDVRKPVGRPKAVSVEAVVALREKHPDGLNWAGVWGALQVGRRTWYDNRDKIQNELLALGHVVVAGVLRWK